MPQPIATMNEAFTKSGQLVPRVGFEPTRSFEHCALNAACLPISAPRPVSKFQATWTSEAKRTQRPASAFQSYRETRACRHVVYLSVRAFITPASPPSRDSHPARRSVSAAPSYPGRFNRRSQGQVLPWPGGWDANPRRSGRRCRNQKGVSETIAHPLVQS